MRSGGSGIGDGGSGLHSTAPRDCRLRICGNRTRGVSPDGNGSGGLGNVGLSAIGYWLSAICAQHRPVTQGMMTQPPLEAGHPLHTFYFAAPPRYAGDDDTRLAAKRPVRPLSAFAAPPRYAGDDDGGIELLQQPLRHEAFAAPPRYAGDEEWGIGDWGWGIGASQHRPTRLQILDFRLQICGNRTRGVSPDGNGSGGLGNVGLSAIGYRLSAIARSTAPITQRMMTRRKRWLSLPKPTPLRRTAPLRRG